MKEIKNKIIDSVFGEFNKELIGDKVKLQNKVNKYQRMIDMINYLQPVEEKEDFVLPDKWCVFRNKKTYHIINKWFAIKENNAIGFIFTDEDGFLCSDQINNNEWISCSYSTPEQGYTEITFEQFKKYVLNK